MLNVMRESLANVKMIFFDFDGVFTDNRVLVDEEGKEYVLCCRSDGIGLQRVQQLGIACMVISAEINQVVSRRCEKLKIDCIQGCDNKLEVLAGILAKKGLAPEQAAFVGNDVSDIECMMHVGVPIAVCDAYPQVREVARFITTCKGGEGAVREVCDWAIEP